MGIWLKTIDHYAIVFCRYVMESLLKAAASSSSPSTSEQTVVCSTINSMMKVPAPVYEQCVAMEKAGQLGKICEWLPQAVPNTPKPVVEKCSSAVQMAGLMASMKGGVPPAIPK